MSGGEQALTGAREDVATIIAALGRLSTRVGEINAVSTGAACKMEMVAGKADESRRELDKVLSDGIVTRDSHFERAVGEFRATNSLVDSRSKGAKPVFDGLVKQERDQSDKFKQGVQELLAGLDSVLGSKMR